MGRGDKIRAVDFSHKEFCKMAGVSERNFLNWLDRFFAMYDIEDEYRRRIKKKQEAGDDYLWPLEWAELMAFLIDTFGENPLFTKTSKRENKQHSFTAEEIVTYYKLLLKKSDERLPEHLKDLIITLDGYIAARKMVDKVPVLVDKIGELVSALLLVGSQQPGDVVDYVQRQLDDWMYNLYRNQYYIRLAKESAKAGIGQELSEMAGEAESDDDKELVAYWQEQLEATAIADNAVSLDVEMVDLLKNMMKLTEYLNPPGEDGEDPWKPLLWGLEDTGDKKLSAKELQQKRMLYYELFQQAGWVSVPQLKMARAALEHYQESLNKPKTIAEKIASGLERMKQLSQEEIRQKRLQALEQEREGLKQNIRLCIERLRELKKENDDAESEALTQQERMHKEYLAFSAALAKERGKYRDASQLFVGQLLLPFFKRGRNLDETEEKKK